MQRSCPNNRRGERARQPGHGRGQRGAAEPPIEREAIGAGVVERDRPFHVAQLADVGVELAGGAQPRKASLVACMMRWPTATRLPWLAYRERPT